MNLLDELALPAKNPRSSCYTADFLEGLDPEIRTGVDAAMADPRWLSTELHALLQRSAGYTHQYTSFRLHRSKRCSCGQDSQ